MNVAENRLALEILDKTESYEPRVQILDLTIEPDGPSGSIKVFIKIGPADNNYNEDEEAEEDEEDGEE